MAHDRSRAPATMVAQLVQWRPHVFHSPEAGAEAALASSTPLGDARIAFVGAGVMAESMIAGLLKNALIPAEHVIASHPREDRRQRLEERFGILTAESNREAAHGADLVFLTIKPQVLQSVMRQLSGSLSAEQV